MIDTESPPGSWREEMLRQPLTTEQLRSVISELKHALAEERRQGARLMTRIAELERTMAATETGWVRMAKHLKHLAVTCRDADAVAYAHQALVSEIIPSPDGNGR